MRLRRRPQAEQDEDEIGTRTQEKMTDWGNVGASVKWGRQWHPRLFANLLVSSSVYSSDYLRDRSFSGTGGGNQLRVSGVYREDNRVEDLTFRLDNEWHVLQGHEIDFGVSISRIGTDYAASFGDTVETLDVQTQAQQTEFYVQERWSPGNPLEFTAGLRTTHHDQTDELYYGPRLSGGWFLTDKVKLKGAWGRCHQFINNISSEDVLQGSRDFWLVADEHISPGSAEHSILGLSYNDLRFLVEVEGYYKSLDGLVDFSPRVGRQQQAEYLGSFFSGQGTARGIEFLVQRKTGKLTGWIGYTLGQVEHTFAAFEDGRPFPANHDRRHEVNAVGSYRVGPWTLSATWVLGSGKAYTAPESFYVIDLADGNTASFVHVGEKNGSRLPDYHRLDLSTSRNFATATFDWSAGLTIFNAYNRANVRARSYDLEVIPVAVTDVTMLGFTPTVYIKAKLK